MLRTNPIQLQHSDSPETEIKRKPKQQITENQKFQQKPPKKFTARISRTIIYTKSLTRKRERGEKRTRLGLERAKMRKMERTTKSRRQRGWSRNEISRRIVLELSLRISVPHNATQQTYLSSSFSIATFLPQLLQTCATDTALPSLMQTLWLCN